MISGKRFPKFHSELSCTSYASFDGVGTSLNVLIISFSSHDYNAHWFIRMTPYISG